MYEPIRTKSVHTHGRRRRLPAPHPRGGAGHPARRASRGSARRHRRARPRQAASHRAQVARLRDAPPPHAGLSGADPRPCTAAPAPSRAAPSSSRHPAPTPPPRSSPPSAWTLHHAGHTLAGHALVIATYRTRAGRAAPEAGVHAGLGPRLPDLTRAEPLPGGPYVRRSHEPPHRRSNRAAVAHWAAGTGR